MKFKIRPALIRHLTATRNGTTSGTERAHRLDNELISLGLATYADDGFVYLSAAGQVVLKALDHLAWFQIIVDERPMKR